MDTFPQTKFPDIKTFPETDKFPNTVVFPDINILPPMFVLPWIPTPPYTTRAPLEYEVDGSVFPITNELGIIGFKLIGFQYNYCGYYFLFV
jgi:hypothetical protein